MALIEVSGFPAGPPSSVTEPLTGRPWADVTLGTTAVPWQPNDRVELAVQDGGTYKMTVQRVGPHGGFARVRLICGTGGLGQNISAKFYREIPAKTVVQEILEECGEQAGEIDLPGTLSAWVRPEGPAHEALRAVMMRYPERLWRMAPDGVVSVGVPRWPDYAPDVAVITEDAAAGTFTTGFTPDLRPGMHATLTRGEEEIGKRVTRVTHSISQEYSYPKNITHVRTTLGTGDGEDGGPAGLDAAIQRSTRWTDYCALYPAEVLRDHGNHELDLKPEHPLLPELTRVRLVRPFAGASVKIKSGGTVLLGFQNADPSRPVALFHAATVLEMLTVTTGKGQTITVDDDRGKVSPEDKDYYRPHIRLTDAAGQLVELWAQDKEEHILIRDRAGQTVFMDATKDMERIRVTDKAGQTVLLDATKDAEKIELRDKAGQSLLLDATVGAEKISIISKAASSLLFDGVTGNTTLSSTGTLALNSAGTMTLNSTGDFAVNAPALALGGGSPVARQGDGVAVATDTGLGFVTNSPTKVTVG